MIHSIPYSDDPGVRIVILHGRYINPDTGRCGVNPAGVTEWMKKNKDKWFSIPLWLYDHSGTVYRVGWDNPFSCPWDSGRVGIIALKRSEWGKGDESDYVMLPFAEGVAEEYTQWANGDLDIEEEVA